MPTIVLPANAASIVLTAGVNIAAGQVVAVNTSGQAVLADADMGSGNWRVVGVALTAATTGNDVRVALASAVVPIEFGTAPASSTNGSHAFLSTTAGEATLAPPFGASTVLASLGVIVGADGVNTAPDVLFQPQVFSAAP